MRPTTSARGGRSTVALAIAVPAALVLAVTGCTEKPSFLLDPSPDPDTAVSFVRDVRPLLGRCTGCHGSPGNSGYSVLTHASLHGPGVEAAGRGMVEVRAGLPDSSYLVWKLEGNPPWPIQGVRMPQGGPYLSAAEIEVIRTWIRDGAPDN
jgi:hypothetical protein